MGINSFLSKIFGNKSQRDLKEITPYVEKVKEAYKGVVGLSHDELRARVTQLRQEVLDYVKEEKDRVEELKKDIEEKDLNEREALWAEVDKIEKEIMDKLEIKLDEILPEVFAIVKDTARRFAENDQVIVTATQFDRDLAPHHDFVSIDGDKAIYVNHWMAGGNEITWDMIHYDVQLFGGVVLHKGRIAEMATGEGKTLVSTLPVFLNAMTGNGVHVVTVNDYLSKRDSEWMGPIYMFHGLSVDCIDKHEPNSDSRRRAYNCDITFGTNNEFGFDYLRDNMARNPSELVQRKHNYAIVDEVDSVLIDDARTPLIISGPIENAGDEMFEEFKPNVEIVVNAQRNLAAKLLTEAKQKIKSEDKKEQEEGYLLLYRSFKGLPKNKPLIKFLSEEGIKANMLKTEAYYMQDNNRNMHIVTDDLYFVIDEKNNQIELTDKGIDLLTGKSDDAQFFVMPDITSQMSQLELENLTEEEKAQKKDELLSNYAIKSERVHTIHQLLKAYTLFEKDDQYVVMDNKVLIVDEQTGRIMDGRRYSDGLHQAIEAKEGVHIEAASQTKATITLQNYFRMYHKLSGMTGTAETEAKEFWDIYKLDVVVIPTNKPIARKDENDRIYKTARAKYAAVIDEIERLISIGRPVLVGTTSVEISELLSKMLSMRKIPHNVLNAKLHQKEAEIVAQAGQKGTVTIATNMAGRGTDIKLSPEVKEAGGLAIIGTERHESRRVDRQLRGRAGRQGDPGSSVFFVSFEDRLMRLFGSERMARILDRLGLKEDDVLEGKQLSRSVENAQTKVEENHFGVRKHLLEYDDVKNAQRKVIYTKRNHALKGERISTDVLNTLMQVAQNISTEYKTVEDFEGLKMEVYRIYALDLPFTEEEFKKLDSNQIADKIMEAATAALKRRMDRIVAIADPVLQNLYQQQGAVIEQIYVPISDGKLMYNIPCNLEEAIKSHSKTIPTAFQKTIMLYTIDEAWEEHLRDMDELQKSIRNVSYENKDPLVVFKVEAFGLFSEMVSKMNKNAVGFVYMIMSLLVRSFGIGLIKKLFPPIVIGPVIILIGLSLAGAGVNMASKNWVLALVSLGFAILASMCGRGMIKLIPLVIGAVAGYIVSLIFYKSSMDFSALYSAPWFDIPHFTKMSFSWEAIIFMAPVAIAPIIEHVGDMYAISSIANKDFIKDPGLHRTMFGDGLATILAAFLGGAPVTTYSEVTGAVSLTKVTDPSVLRIAGVAAVIMSVIGKVGAAIQTIPQAVLGGIMLLLFGSIASVGISNMIDAKLNMGSTRNLIIASLILTIGIGGAIINIGSFSLSGIGLASLVGVVLNLILPKEKN